jgi:hypothetical protein
MAPNTNSDYVLEILEQVIAHTKQVVEKGYCNCFCNAYHSDTEKTAQFNCVPAERLYSVMRGEEQNYEEDVNNITPFKFIWMDNNIQDRNWFL